jgi:Tol biopolymer transport system component
MPLSELKHRRVGRAIIGYGVVAFALLQIVEPIMHGLHMPEQTLTWVVIALVVAFPFVVAVAWTLERSQARSLVAAGGVPAPVLHPLRSVSIAATAIAFLLIVAGVYLARRRAAPAPGPRLVQVTFEGGIEEFPAWSADGKQLVYAAQVGPVRKLFRKDLSGGAPAQITQGPFDDLQPAWSPSADRVIFIRAREEGHKLQPGDPFGVWAGADVFSLDVRTGKEERLIESAANPAFSPDGSRIAVDAEFAGPRRIWLVDAQGHNPLQATTDTSEEVVHLAPRWSPDGKKIVFQNAQRTKYDVRVVDLESKKLSSITDDFPADIRPVWSPSGKFIYFTSDRGGGYNIWRAPVDENGGVRGPLEQVTTGAGQDVEAALSPDGALLAFTTLRQNADLWRLPVSPQTGKVKGEPSALVTTTREDSRGAWSFDGTQVAFNSDRGGDMNIWVQPVAGGAARRITSGSGGDYQPNWSPDGTRIAFFSSRGGRPGIFAVDVATGAITPLATGASIAGAPFYSPDGKRIAFQSDKSGRNEVWVMNADGSDQRQLTNVGVGGHFLRWLSNDTIVFRCITRLMLMTVPAAGGELVPFAPKMKGGAHISLSPDHSHIMDVMGHRVLWSSPVAGGDPEKVFEFSDPDVRIDYPVWSPDGAWVLFDRTHPEGGDIWVLRVEE